MYFRWLFPKLASYKTLTNSSDDLINSFTRTVTDIAGERDPKFGIITQMLYSFLKNEATNPAGCIRDFLRGDLTKFPGNSHARVPGGILSEFLQEFRKSFEGSILPTVDGVSYSSNILSLLCKTVLQKDWAEVVNKFEEIENAEDALSLIYAECLNFFDYIEKCHVSSPIESYKVSNPSLVMCLADVIGNHTRDRLQNMAWVVFDYVNKYRKIP